MSDKKFGRKFWLTILFLLLIATVAYYIFTQHEAHILAYSSYIIIIIFILAHLLMHRGHGHHHGHRGTHHKNKDHEKSQSDDE